MHSRGTGRRRAEEMHRRETQCYERNKDWKRVNEPKKLKLRMKRGTTQKPRTPVRESPQTCVCVCVCEWVHWCVGMCVCVFGCVWECWEVEANSPGNEGAFYSSILICLYGCVLCVVCCECSLSVLHPGVCVLMRAGAPLALAAVGCTVVLMQYSATK